MLYTFVQDAADILSRATLSPLEMTASSPPITLSAVPSAASWSVPISVGVDQLRPYTAYLFEVSAFTSDGEGQIASTMVRMPESGLEEKKLASVFTSFYHGYKWFVDAFTCHLLHHLLRFDDIQMQSIVH